MMATFSAVLASLLVLHLDFNTVQMKKDAVVDCLRVASRAGYNAVLWEIENKVRWETCPECVHPEAFSKDEFREILAEAERLGLEPIPLLQTFGHAEYVLCHEKYAGWRESPSFRACYCVSKPEVKAFQKALLHEYLELFGSRVRRFHLGGDEALVFGTCEVCRQHDKMDLYVKHLQEVSGELAERGIRPGVWADMVLMGGNWESRHTGSVSAETVRKLPTAFTLWNWDYAYGTSDAKLGNAAQTASLTGLGYEVILCAASQSFSDSPFLPRFRRHGENIAACADLVRTNALAGFCMTSWSVHLFPKSVQYPLWEFAAKRLADASVDWEPVVSARWNGLAPDLVDRLSDWNGDYAKFDVRIYGYEKPALPAPPGELAKRLNAMDKNGVRPRIRDRARQDLRRIESALAELKGRATKGADGARVLETGAELNAAFLRGVIGALDGRCGVPELPTDATRNYYQSWQSRMSAANATALAWSLLGQKTAAGDAKPVPPLEEGLQLLGTFEDVPSVKEGFPGFACFNFDSRCVGAMKVACEGVLKTMTGKQRR